MKTTTMDYSNYPTKMDINDLPSNQQDRVIRFASELAKNLRQIQLAAKQRQKNENAPKSSQQITEKAKKNERK